MKIVEERIERAGQEPGFMIMKSEVEQIYKTSLQQGGDSSMKDKIYDILNVVMKRGEQG